MKKASKIIAVATVVAVSLISVSTYAAVKQDRTPRNPFSRNPERIELTEEKKAEMLEKTKSELTQKLEEGKITQEQYDKAIEKLESGESTHMGGISKRGFQGKRPEMTEEKKAEMLEKTKSELTQKLEEGKITQEQYDKATEKLESGEPTHMGGIGKRGFQGKRPEMTEEKKAEMLEKTKSELTQKLEEGKITHEQYDKALERLESGDFFPMKMGKRGMQEGNRKKFKMRK